MYNELRKKNQQRLKVAIRKVENEWESAFRKPFKKPKAKRNISLQMGAGTTSKCQQISIMWRQKSIYGFSN